MHPQKKQKGRKNGIFKELGALCNKTITKLDTLLIVGDLSAKIINEEHLQNRTGEETIHDK